MTGASSQNIYLIIIISGYIRANIVVFGKKWLYSDKSDCIREKLLYSAKSLYSGKVVVVCKNCLYSGKSDYIRAKWLYSVKVVVFGKGG